MLNKTITFFRTLTFGGLLGLGIAWLTYKHNQPYFTGKVLETHFLAFGGALGASVHRAIDSALRFIMDPLFSYIKYRVKLWLLNGARMRGQIREVDYQYWGYILTVKFIFGEEIKVTPSDNPTVGGASGTSKHLMP